MHTRPYVLWRRSLEGEGQKAKAKPSGSETAITAGGCWRRLWETPSGWSHAINNSPVQALHSLGIAASSCAFRGSKRISGMAIKIMAEPSCPVWWSIDWLLPNNLYAAPSCVVWQQHCASYANLFACHPRMWIDLQRRPLTWWLTSVSEGTSVGLAYWRLKGETQPRRIVAFILRRFFLVSQFGVCWLAGGWLF